MGPDGSVVMTFHAVNDASDRVPFIWSAHPVLPLGPETKVLLPEGAVMRLYKAHKLAMGDSRSQHHWPFVRTGGRVLDFLTPYHVAREYACKLFMEMPVGRARLREGDLEKARGYLERVRDLAPKDVQAYYNLALLHQRAGREDLAREAMARFQALKAEMGKRLDGIDDSLGTVQSDVKSMKQELFGVTGNNGMRRDLRRTRELQVKHDRLLVELATKAGIPAKLETEEHD